MARSLTLWLCSIFILAPASASAAGEVQLNKGETLSIGSVTRDPGYPLDSMSRQVPVKGRLRCPKIKKVRYKGDTLRYHAAVFVNLPFRERLKKFELVVVQTAKDVYGRAPRTIRHVGTYNCRRIGGYPNLVSEHGIANGIDVAGFDFAPLKRGSTSELPRSLRRRFRVRLLKHWGATKGVAYTYHRRFLRLLAARLVRRHDIFRVLLGPAYPGHKDHFHFDVSPWRLVDI
ncbi:MAG TPA: hypothetical protein DCQ06_12885 [Myxococcales bacterium]|nr:hypothetical protein [Myxococcales bacterium]HAN32484.1 hypothetical protein [Myxococcales bacterium]